MLRSLSAGVGALGLARRPHPVYASLTTTTTPTRTRPSRPLSSPLISSHLTQSRSKWTWANWVRLHPTSAEDLQTVYNVCIQSGLFVKVKAQRPKRTVESITDQFRQTPGLRPADWEAHGLPWLHAVQIATRLHEEDFFTTFKAPKKLTLLVARWPQIWARAKAGGSGRVVSNPDVAAAEFEAARENVGRPTSVIAAARKAMAEDSTALRMAVQARRVLYFRMTQGKAPGKAQKRRPPPSVYTELEYASDEKLRRVERRGREVIIEQQITKLREQEGITDEAVLDAKRQELWADDRTRNKYTVDE
ncbi:unnamed protein product [Discula destructiva]